MQTEFLQDRLGVAGEFLKQGGGVIWVGDLDQLNLVELMRADNAAVITAGAASLAAEAGGVSGEFHRQLVFGEQGVTVEIGDWHLSGGGEEQ